MFVRNTEVRACMTFDAFTRIHALLVLMSATELYVIDCGIMLSSRPLLLLPLLYTCSIVCL